MALPPNGFSDEVRPNFRARIPPNVDVKRFMLDTLFLAGCDQENKAKESLSNGDVRGAIDHFTEVIEIAKNENSLMGRDIDERTGYYYYQRGLAYEQLGETDKAISEHQRALDIYARQPKDALPEEKHLRKLTEELARKHIDDLRDLNGNKLDYSRIMEMDAGIKALKKGDYKGAVDHLTQSIDLAHRVNEIRHNDYDVETGIPLYFRAQAYDKINEPGKALGDYRQALSILSQNPASLDKDTEFALRTRINALQPKAESPTGGQPSGLWFVPHF